MAKLNKLPSSGFHHRQPCYKQGKNPFIEPRTYRIRAASPRRQPASSLSWVARVVSSSCKESTILCVKFKNSFAIVNPTVKIITVSLPFRKENQIITLNKSIKQSSEETVTNCRLLIQNPKPYEVDGAQPTAIKLSFSPQ